MVPGEYLRSRPVLDELGYLPIDKQGADLLFQVVATRHEVGSIVITTNRPFREWGKLFDVDNTLAMALIDRLMHHGEGIVIQGDSYRVRDKDSESTDEWLKRGTSTFGSGVRCEVSWLRRERRGSSSPPSSKPSHRAGSLERPVPRRAGPR
jgi:IstB-like ATP binding protein